MPKIKKTKSSKLRPIGSPVPKEILAIVPYADSRCRICRLPVEELRKIHKYKYDKGWSYKQIAEYLSAMDLCGKDYRSLSKHFTKHVRTSEDKKLIRKDVDPEVIQVLQKIENPQDDIIVSEKDIEKAYHILIRMVADFSKHIDKVSKVANVKLDDEKEYEKALESASVIQLLGTTAGLQKELANQIKTIAALRTPKIIIAHVFGDFVDDMTRELNSLLLDTFYSLQDEVTEALSNGGITNDTFLSVFRKAAIKYKDKMLLLRREHMNKVKDALADMEKVV